MDLLYVFQEWKRCKRQGKLKIAIDLEKNTSFDDDSAMKDNQAFSHIWLPSVLVHHVSTKVGGLFA